MSLKMAAKTISPFAKAKAVFTREGGTLRMSEAIKLGLSRRVLYAMLEAGEVERVSRGIYRLADLPSLGNPDLVTVALRVPRGVICLISAAAYHDLTTQIPHKVDVALERGAQIPRVEFPPIRVYRFSRIALNSGIEVHELDGVKVRIYSREKTVADCFKYRNKIGMDVALETLREWWDKRDGATVQDLLDQARHCRVATVMMPYVESLL
jgi:predicted transcriptional regulator of viral defense system